MGLILAPPKRRIVKPPPWDVHPSLVEPRWRWAWDDLSILVPMWDVYPDVREVLSSQILTAAGDSLPTRATSLYGISGQTAAADERWTITDADLPRMDDPTDAVTIAVAAIFDNAASENFGFIGGSVVSGGGISASWYLQAAFGNHQDFILKVDGADTSVRLNNVFADNDGVPMLLVGKWSTGGPVWSQAYKIGGGLLGENSSAGVSGTIDSPVTFFISQPEDNRATMAGNFLATYVWSRELSNHELTQLARDPFGPFRPMERLWIASGAAGGTTFNQSLGTTSIAVLGLDTVASYLRTLSATGVASVGMTKLVDKGLSVVGSVAPNLVKEVRKELSETAIAVSDLSTIAAVSQELSVTGVGVLNLNAITSYFRTLSVVASTSAGITKLVDKGLSVVGVVAPDLVKEVRKTLSDTAVAVADLSTTATVSQQLDATATAISQISTGFIHGVTLSATATAVASLVTDFIAGVPSKWLQGILKNTLSPILKVILKGKPS